MTDANEGGWEADLPPAAIPLLREHPATTGPGLNDEAGPTGLRGNSLSLTFLQIARPQKGEIERTPVPNGTIESPRLTLLLDTLLHVLLH